MEPPEIPDRNLVWKTIPQYEEYLISEKGDIYSRWTNRSLKPQKDKNGYLQVSLFKKDGMDY